MHNSTATGCAPVVYSLLEKGVHLSEIQRLLVDAPMTTDEAPDTVRDPASDAQAYLSTVPSPRPVK